MTKSIVTGATGFIGRRLCRLLKNKGEYVTAIARGERPAEAGDGLWDEYYGLDLSSDNIPHAAFAGADVIYHLAGKAHALAERVGVDDGSYERVNHQATLKLSRAAAAHGVGGLVFFSSVKVLGEGGAECLGDDARPNPITPYAVSKYRCEQALRESGVARVAILRLSMVYGPGGKGNLPRMAEAVRRGVFPPLANIHNKRSMIHVDDVANIAWLAARRMRGRAAGGCESYILTDGRVYSISEIYREMRAALGLPATALATPLVLLKAAAWCGDVVGRVSGRRMPLDSDALNKLIGDECYTPSIPAGDFAYRCRYTLSDYLQTLRPTSPKP